MLTLARWLRTLRAPAGPLRYLLSLTEQGFVSALNLASNLLLIRHLEPAQYGLFVLSTNAALIISNLQATLTIAHLMALPAGPPSRPERAQPERMILLMTLLMIATSAIGGALAVAALDWQVTVVPAALALYLPALMLYTYTRALAFSRGLVATATVQSAMVLLGASGLLAITSLARHRPGVETALLCLAAAYGGSGLLTLARLCHGMIGHLRLRDLLHFRAYVRESLWVLVGVASIELLGRFNSIIVSVWFGTAAVGTLAATQLLLRPIGLLVSACGLIGRVAMVEQRDAGDWTGFVRSVLLGVAGSLALSVPWVITVYLAWPIISTHLFRGLYADDSWIVLLSGLSTITGAVLAVLSLGFQALRRFRLLAYADMAGALVSVAVTMLLLRHFGFALSVVGMTTGQILDVILLAVMLFRLLPRPETGPRAGRGRWLASATGREQRLSGVRSARQNGA